MRVSLIGPMTGLPEWNYPAFCDAAHRLREHGHDVFNPAETFGGDTDHPRSEFMRASIAALLRADAVALLPGWEQSPGAKTELRVALSLDLRIAPLHSFLWPRTLGERPQQHSAGGRRFDSGSGATPRRLPLPCPSPGLRPAGGGAFPCLQLLRAVPSQVH